jgi:signal transduction histidine kinase
VRETLDAYRFQLQKQGFTVEEDLVDGLPLMNIDPEAMTQALLNLIDNALKYSPDRKHLRIEMGKEDGEVVIAVEDHGVGIAPRDQARIFDMFYRAERGLVHSVKGSGLGLSLVKHIAGAHDGRVTVRSRPGEGSRFAIHIPLGESGSST